ncbi:MAG: diguanylate cyclase, partial [Gammaproteobacteria bacterium]
SQTEIIALLETILDSIIINDNNNKTKKINKFKKFISKVDSNNNADITRKFSALVNELLLNNDVVENSNTPEVKTPEIERRKDNRAVDHPDRDIDRSIDSKKNSLVAPAVGELILQLMSRFPPSFSKRLNEKELARAASSARNRKDLLQIIDKISHELSQFIRQISTKEDDDESSENESDGEVLIHLLQRISLPDYLSEQALKLKQDIEKGDSDNSITNMVEATADLIMQMRLRLQAEKQELEQFLSEISKHLKALDIDIQVTSRLRNESVENLQQYDDDLEKEVQGLETGIKETDELEGLKGLVTERVKTIRLHMGAFRKSEEQRNTTAEETIKKLTSRITDMEQETESLREQVAKEHNSAVRDALTKIPNRLAYEERISSEIERCKRYKSAMAFVVWDIDHFKGINDHYGHIAGDKVLTVIAEVLRQNLRAADFIARYGGEEFVVIMPETEIDKAAKGCEKIRLAIENCNFHYRDTSVPITASCGYTAYSENDTKESLFERADKALYKAKQNGRNQCVKA